MIRLKEYCLLITKVTYFRTWLHQRTTGREGLLDGCDDETTVGNELVFFVGNNVGNGEGMLDGIVDGKIEDTPDG